MTATTRYASARSAGARTIDAALRILATASADEVLSLLTLEALRNEMSSDGLGPPPSSRTIAQTFRAGDGHGGFDRRVLLEALLEQVVNDMVAATQASADGFLQAADTIGRGGGVEAFAAAMDRTTRAREPGGSDDELYARERYFHLALALNDHEPGLTRALRRFHREYGEAFDPVHEAFLHVFNRRLATDVSLEDLRIAVHSYLRGILVHKRSGVHISDQAIVSTTLRIMWAHTTPIAGTGRSVLDDLWSGASGPARRSYA